MIITRLQFYEIFTYFNTFLHGRKQVQGTKVEADKDGVTVPTTIEQYCVDAKPKPLENSHLDMDFYDDDYMDDDDEDEEHFCYHDDGDDSGNGES